MKQELVKYWMSREVVTIELAATWLEAGRLMKDRQIGRLPVLNHGDLVGIVTLSDVREAKPPKTVALSLWELSYMLSNLELEKVMTPDPITIAPEAKVYTAAKLMLKHKISGLPVVDRTGNLVGMITESDIFRLMVEKWDEEMIPSISIPASVDANMPM